MLNYSSAKGILITTVGDKIYLEPLSPPIPKCKCRARNYYLLCRIDRYLLSLDSWMRRTWNRTSAIGTFHYGGSRSDILPYPQSFWRWFWRIITTEKGFQFLWKVIWTRSLKWKTKNWGKPSFMRLRNTLFDKCKHMGIDAFHITIFTLRIYFSFNEKYVLSLLRELGTQLI